MAFDWLDFLNLSKSLLSVDNEAAYRSAISRAYYFVFHLAKDRAEPNGLTLRKTDSHHKLTWAFFEGSSDPECRRLGALGMRLRDQRNKADYDKVYRGRIKEEADAAIKKAAEFKASLSSVPDRLPNIGSQQRSYTQ